MTIAFHWAVGVLILGLLASGLALFDPRLRNYDFVGVKLVKELHLTLAVLLPFVPLTVAAWDSGRTFAREARQLAWRMTDLAWLLAPLRVGLTGGRPQVGRYNALQKAFAAWVAALLTALAVSGAVVWPDALLAPDARALAYGAHDLLTLLLVPSLTVHVFLAVAWPTTRPALSGMLSGQVPAEWLALHHPADPGPPADE